MAKMYKKLMEKTMEYETSRKERMAAENFRRKTEYKNKNLLGLVERKFRPSKERTYETDDLSIFKKMPGNREVNEKNIQKIVKSIEEVGDMKTIILVNEKMEVIDGQHRIEAYKRLNLPCLFQIREGAGIRQCIEMNQNSRPWHLNDWVNLYEKGGNENYILLSAYIKKHERLPMMVVASCMSKVWSNNVSKNLKDGTFKIEISTKSVHCLDFLENVFDSLESAKGSRTKYLHCLITCYKAELIDSARMEKQIHKYAEEGQILRRCSTTMDAVGAIQEVYNYRKRGKNIVYFYDEYQRAIANKGNFNLKCYRGKSV